MARTLFLLFNHTFTQAQEADARASLGVERIVALPEPFQTLWSTVPPELEAIGPFLEPIHDWLRSWGESGDLVFIQGEFGACHLTVEAARRLGLVPVYSTTRRRAVEEQLEDGTVRVTHVFQHERFRRYGV